MVMDVVVGVLGTSQTPWSLLPGSPDQERCKYLKNTGTAIFSSIVIECS